jgi:hypothetical protein
MKIEVYKDLHNRTIYRFNYSFYIDTNRGLERVPKFLQTWYSKWIEEKREDLIKVYNEFNNAKTNNHESN